MSMSSAWRRTTAHPAAGMLAFVLRLLLASIWLRYAWGKIEAGWLTSNVLHPLVQIVADGQTPASLSIYSPLARWVLELGLDRVLSVAFPIAELAIAVALVTGWKVRTSALLATIINLNLVLSGLASWQLDGRIIALQLLLLAFGAAAGRYGLRPSSLRSRGARTPSPRTVVPSRRRGRSRMVPVP